jgi:hypothetical protein
MTVLCCGFSRSTQFSFVVSVSIHHYRYAIPLRMELWGSDNPARNSGNLVGNFVGTQMKVWRIPIRNSCAEARDNRQGQAVKLEFF